jgi:hypothetical protein
MIAEPPIHRRGLLSRLTTPQVTALIILSLAVLFAFPLAVQSLWLGGYLVLVLVTCVTLRGARREPGSWLGQRTVRRAVVLLIAADCLALLAIPTPVSSSIITLLLFLVVLNVALGGATQRLASAPDRLVDERQEALRNQAHRIAYAIFGVAVGGTIAVTDIASEQTRSWLGSTVGGGGLFVFLELIFVLPAMVLAFLERNHQPADVNERSAGRSSNQQVRLAMILLGLTVAIPPLLSLGVAVLPVRTTSSAQPPTLTAAVSQSGAGARVWCQEFFATSDVGVGVEARLQLHAQACWDGKRAYESWGMNSTDCFPSATIVGIATVEQCTRTTGADGTLSFIYRSDVSPGLIPFLHRHVTLTLVIDRNGNVERFP